MLLNKFDLQLFAGDKTKLTDLIVPEIYEQYMRENSTKLSRLITSGLALTTEEMTRLASGAGVTVNVPFLKPISGASQIIDDTNALTTNKMTARKQVGVRLVRGNAWEFADIATILSGADPVGALYEQLAEYWREEEQTIAINILKGLFGTGGCLSTSHMVDISSQSGAAANISAEQTLTTKQKLGDNAFKIASVAMHSAVYTYLQKKNLIEFIPDSRGEIAFTRYLGYNVIVDDDMPAEGGVYTTVFFGNGAFSYGSGTPNGLEPIEADRDILGSSEVVVSRRSFVIHPNGISWKGGIANATPTNAELSTASSWEKVFDDKNIAMVALKHKIDQVA